MIIIGINDILPGKGKKVGCHSGNVQFRSIIEKHVREYYTPDSITSKRKVVEKVRCEVENLNPPGRFLAVENGHHYELAEEGIEIKIKQAFRDKAKALRFAAKALRDKMEVKRKEVIASSCENVQIPTHVTFVF